MLFELKAVTFETIQRIDVIPMVAGLIDNILVHQFAQALVHGLGANAGIVIVDGIEVHLCFPLLQQGQQVHKYFEGVTGQLKGHLVYLDEGCLFYPCPECHRSGIAGQFTIFGHHHLFL